MGRSQAVAAPATKANPGDFIFRTHRVGDRPSKPDFSTVAVASRPAKTIVPNWIDGVFRLTVMSEIVPAGE
jgi:hypothetical protein